MGDTIKKEDIDEVFARGVFLSCKEMAELSRSCCHISGAYAHWNPSGEECSHADCAARDATNAKFGKMFVGIDMASVKDSTVTRYHCGAHFHETEEGAQECIDAGVNVPGCNSVNGHWSDPENPAYCYCKALKCESNGLLSFARPTDLPSSNGIRGGGDA